MRKTFTTLVSLLLLSSDAAWAEMGAFISLGTFDKSSVFVGSGRNANRVGNAVLTYVHQVSSVLGVSGQMLVACDGTWHSDSIRFSMATDEPPTPQAYEGKARAEEALAAPLDQTQFIDWNQSKLFYGPALRAQVQPLCRGAVPEPKNMLIPISIYDEDEKTAGGTTAVLTGTLVRKGSELDVWTRTTFFKLETTMLGGKPWVLDGVEQKHKVPVGTYEMRRTAYDCANNKMATYQSIDYSKQGAVTKQQGIPRANLQLSDVVPNSVGESQLDAICKIYGRK